MLHIVLSAQEFGRNFLENVGEKIRSIPTVWNNLMQKLGTAFNKIPINWYRVWSFIEAHFWELIILIVALAILGMVLRFCKKVIRVVLSAVSLATCAYCIYVMFF